MQSVIDMVYSAGREFQKDRSKSVSIKSAIGLLEAALKADDERALDYLAVAVYHIAQAHEKARREKDKKRELNRQASEALRKKNSFEDKLGDVYQPKKSDFIISPEVMLKSEPSVELGYSDTHDCFYDIEIKKKRISGCAC